MMLAVATMMIMIKIMMMMLIIVMMTVVIQFIRKGLDMSGLFEKCFQIPTVTSSAPPPFLKDVAEKFHHGQLVCNWILVTTGEILISTF